MLPNFEFRACVQSPALFGNGRLCWAPKVKVLHGLQGRNAVLENGDARSDAGHSDEESGDLYGDNIDEENQRVERAASQADASSVSPHPMRLLRFVCQCALMQDFTSTGQPVRSQKTEM